MLPGILSDPLPQVPDVGQNSVYGYQCDSSSLVVDAPKNTIMKWKKSGRRKFIRNNYIQCYCKTDNEMFYTTKVYTTKIKMYTHYVLKLF